MVTINDLCTGVFLENNQCRIGRWSLERGSPDLLEDSPDRVDAFGATAGIGALHCRETSAFGRCIVGHCLRTRKDERNSHNDACLTYYYNMLIRSGLFYDRLVQ